METPNKNQFNGAVQGIANQNTNTSSFNALEFMVRQMLMTSLETSKVVKVVAVESGGSEAVSGYVDVVPLVASMDALGNTIDPATIYHLPYGRLQGGVAALVIDPIPGDIGIAVFCKEDSSNVIAGTSSPQQPGSFRNFDQADGFYIPAFLNKVPKVFIELFQNEKIVIHGQGGVTINSQAGLTVNASSGVILNAASGATVNGDLKVNGSIKATQNISSGKNDLDDHRHGGVESGGSTTSIPIGSI